MQWPLFTVTYSCQWSPSLFLLAFDLISYRWRVGRWLVVRSYIKETWRNHSKAIPSTSSIFKIQIIMLIAIWTGHSQLEVTPSCRTIINDQGLSNIDRIPQQDLGSKQRTTVLTVAEKYPRCGRSPCPGTIYSPSCELNIYIFSSAACRLSLNINCINRPYPRRVRHEVHTPVIITRYAQRHFLSQGCSRAPWEGQLFLIYTGGK